MQRIVDLYEKNKALLSYVQEIIDACRVQNFNHAARTFKLVAGSISTLISDMDTKNDIFSGEFSDMFKSRLMMTIQDVLSAQEKDDYILIADTLEINMLPLLYELQNVLAESSGIENSKNNFWNNIDCLKQTDAKLADALISRYESMKKYCEGLEIKVDDNDPQIAVQGYYDGELKRAYYIERTQSGYPTLKIETESEEFYLCGNINPYRDGITLFNHYFDMNAEEYIILGTDIGYLPSAIFKTCTDAVPVTIYEPDLNVLVFTFENVNLVPLIDNGYKFIYDNNLQSFSQKLLEKTEKDILIMQHPAIRNIKDIAIKEKTESLFVQDASAKNQLFDMMTNFKSNIKNCNHYVDELKDRIKGKDVYILAAGPSLDKNIEMIRNKPDNSVIIAVGRIYHMLEAKNIKPDFYTFLDSSVRTYGFMSGHEENNIPLLLCSTACKYFAIYSKADKYIVCQNGFSEAEEYAKSKDYQIYDTGGSVATIAFDVAVRLGAKRIIAMGLDLAYTDNQTHSSGAYNDSLNDTAGLVKVKSISGDELYTTKAMDIYRQWFESRIMKAKSEGNETEFINATEGGAFINGMHHKTLNEVINE